MKITDGSALMRTLAALTLTAALLAQETPVESRARAILDANCLKCHGGDQTLSGLDINALTKGGSHGPAIVPGKPDDSRLFQWVSSGRMPMGGAKLPAAEIAALRDWIAAGGILPQKSTSAKRVFWSLKPPVKPPTPEGHPIDGFVRAKLAEKGLEPAPRADHRTLIRRLSFDLTGLPPTPDLYKLTYQQAIDRLLASRHYGERWGRHWLDVVRFGETDGGEHNYERWNAWRYRDYVIRSFNEDKPYPQFIREQVAGDLLDSYNPDLVAATGFLVAGPWDQVSAELNKDKIMAATARMDELDDMVTTTFHTFQGMTVNCARCHNHKFDPIPTRDYYRLTAVFRGVGFGNRKVATAEAQARYEEASKPVRVELERVKRDLEAIEDPVRNQVLRVRYMAFDRQRDSEPSRIPLNPIWNRNRFAPVTAQHWRLVITGHRSKLPQVSNLKLMPSPAVVEEWQGTVKATPENPVVVPIPAPGKPVSELTWSGHLTVYRLEASADGATWRTVCSSLDHIDRNELSLPMVEDDEWIAKLKPESRARRTDLLAEIARLEKSLEAIAAPPIVYAARPRDLEKAYVLERGSVSKPGEEVGPGTLSAVGHGFNLPTEASDRERRLALADWIASPDNPLTARVLVNRVWHYHFGQGIVNTPSDFGLNGDRPSHAELLDWLAVSFMENGWSMKWLHRQILTSATYQQSDRFNEKANSIDAANRLLWRMPLKRMDAETLRDSMLFVTGKLDLAHQGGPSYLLQKKGTGGSYIYAALDNDGPEVWKRAVYRFVVRGGERIMLDSFDCPDPAVATPQRSISNTPVQALTLLNNAFVLKQSALLAERIERESADDPVGRAYELVFGRQPSPREREVGSRFIKDQSLAAYCRVLFNSNEFVYVP